ncbi:type 2A phosphatase-associated protein 42 [[Candida] jaroonii]|uniref:Type 2A phosphatase-associated protein 42 n=1 Tax=[Candida] jaroonii TaxID=467808 RepID=A0ACA9Y865_9ASCO|nr:type 2A phosphatase-associated protein 42 [[Candida] jaroonii]
MSGQTIREKYQWLVSEVTRLQDVSPKNTIEFQTQLLHTIKQFDIIRSMIDSLDVFSDNEFFEEINPVYLPFLNIDYYSGELKSMVMSDGQQVGVEFKLPNLIEAKEFYNQYLQRLKSMEVLNVQQIKQLDGHTLSREDKIEAYKYEKSLKAKLASQTVKEDDDEDTKRDLYTDEIKLLVMKCLNSLNLLDMEIQVLGNRPEPKIQEIQSDDRERSKIDDDGFSTKLDVIPQNLAIGDLIKNGKVMRPFTITRQNLKDKVFGTGQVLPSMTVEEYVDWELANGKMAKPEEPKPEKDSDAEDEEEEYKAREWDDWKDDNPKGMGNTMNLG